MSSSSADSSKKCGGHKRGRGHVKGERFGSASPNGYKDQSDVEQALNRN
jgi:hypothetical protein